MGVLFFCKSCENNLAEESFYKRKDGKPLYPCKKCKIKIAKNRFLKSKSDQELKSKLKGYAKKSFQNNKEKIYTKHKIYKLNNKDYYKNYQKEYEKLNPRKNRKRSKNIVTVESRLRASISRAISKNIKKHGGEKIESSINRLDYSYAELKMHLESLFESWMNWGNYGIYDPKSWNDEDPSTWKWQIDHVVPHSNFNYKDMNEEYFKECWSLQNLRPYSAKQNILDGSNRTRHKK